jgi:hypothetical protein
LIFVICKKDTTNADDERRCLRRKTYRGIHGTEQIFKKNKIYVAQIQRPQPCSTEPNHYQQTMDQILARQTLATEKERIMSYESSRFMTPLEFSRATDGSGEKKSCHNTKLFFKNLNQMNAPAVNHDANTYTY